MRLARSMPMTRWPSAYHSDTPDRSSVVGTDFSQAVSGGGEAFMPAGIHSGNSEAGTVATIRTSQPDGPGVRPPPLFWYMTSKSSVSYVRRKVTYSFRNFVRSATVAKAVLLVFVVAGPLGLHPTSSTVIARIKMRIAMDKEWKYVASDAGRGV